MTFVESIKTCLLQKYISVQGRASRSEYWWFALFSYVVNFVCSFLPLISIVVSLALIIPSITVAVRRCHDLGKTGWLILAPAAGIILGALIMCTAIYTQSESMLSAGSIILILGALGGVAISIYFIFPGTQGANKYGEGPYVFTEQKATVQA